MLPHPNPPGTARETFTSYNSSTDKALLHTRPSKIWILIDFTIRDFMCQWGHTRINSNITFYHIFMDVPIDKINDSQLTFHDPLLYLSCLFKIPKTINLINIINSR